MSYESAFFKNLVGGTLPKLPEPGFVSSVSTHTLGISEKPTLLEDQPQPPDPTCESEISRFREWWWYALDTGTDDPEFNAESAEAASELLPLLRNLVWPDFQVEAVGSILKLKRVCERHYPVSDVPDADASGS